MVQAIESVDGSVIRQLRKIETTKDGEPNGFVVPIWRADENEPIKQVYLTVVNPGCSKGPHLHMKRCGRFTCITGTVDIITREYGVYYVRRISPDHGDWATIFIPPGVAAEIRCVGDEPAYLLNMPDPAWSAEDPDEWPVADWEPDHATA